MSNWQSGIPVAALLLGLIFLTAKVTFEVQFLWWRESNHFYDSAWFNQLFEKSDVENSQDSGDLFQKENDEIEETRKRRRIDEKNWEYRWQKRFGMTPNATSASDKKTKKSFRIGDQSPYGRQGKSKSSRKAAAKQKSNCKNSAQICPMELVETVPIALSANYAIEPLERSLRSTLETWLELIAMAKRKLEISSQWSIIRDETGQAIFGAFKNGEIQMKLPLLCGFSDEKKSCHYSYPEAWGGVEIHLYRKEKETSHSTQKTSQSLT